MKHRYSRREFLSVASATAAATFWISKAMPATVHQGYAIHIPFRLELNYA